MPTGTTGALSLAQFAQQSNDPLVLNVVKSLLQNDNPFNDIPLVTKPTLKANGARLSGNLATPAWRALNGSSTVASSTVSPFQEQLYVLSNLIDIDRMMLMDQNAIGDPRGVQVNALMTAWSYDLADKFFNNNHNAGDANAFVGIRKRLDDTTTWGTNSACKINGSGVDMTTAMTAATAATFIELIDQALSEIGSDEGDGVVIYMNRLLKRRFARAVRMLGSGGGFDMTRDAFDRPVTMYRGAKVRTIGVKADQSTEIITNTEDTSGNNGSSNYTSMYMVRYGEGYFGGWQMEPLQAKDIGLRADEPSIYRVFCELGVGLYQEHTRAAARVYDIKVS